MAFREGQIPTGGISFANNRAKALVGSKTSPALMEVVQNAMKATNKNGFLQTARFIMSDGYSPEEIGAQIKTPTLLIVGLEDKVSPLEKNGERLKKYMPNASLEVFKDIGHLPHLEMPEKVNNMALDFFKEK
jgi:pimeloyl-ACP methyl ester carboxylesterase